MTHHHLSAMRKIAANIGKQPYVAPAEKSAPDSGQRAALRFAVGLSSKGEITCYWTIRYPDRTPDQKHPVYSFPVNNMVQEEFLNEVIARSLPKITAQAKGAIRVAIHQDNLRKAYRKAHGSHPTVSIIHDESPIANQLNTDALDQLKQVIADEKAKREQQALSSDRTKTLKLSGTSSARTIYVDASYMPGSESMGYGYVIKDVLNASGNTKRWHLTYGLGTGTTSTEIGDDATGAELRAIRDVLLIHGVLNKDVRNNHRSLFIATDSKWSVSILKALRENKKQSHLIVPVRDVRNMTVPIRDDWMNTAQEIINTLEGIQNVTFQWVRGHNGDPLNEAADRLGKTARKNLENDAPDEHKTESKRNIIAIMINTLTNRGITARADEHATSVKRNC